MYKILFNGIRDFTGVQPRKSRIGAWCGFVLSSVQCACTLCPFSCIFFAFVAFFANSYLLHYQLFPRCSRTSSTRQTPCGTQCNEPSLIVHSLYAMSIVLWPFSFHFAKALCSVHKLTHFFSFFFPLLYFFTNPSISLSIFSLGQDELRARSQQG